MGIEAALTTLLAPAFATLVVWGITSNFERWEHFALLRNCVYAGWAAILCWIYV